MEAYSVLMSVYHKEKPEHFSECIKSMVTQTVVTDDFVIVCDGPLTPQLDAVLEGYDRQYPGVFNIIRLPENVGIGAAANIGLEQCKNELVAKMDADDLAVPDRCEKQLKLFQEAPDLVICGGYIEEFSDDPQKPFAIRAVPTDNEQIRKFARRRQPFNNMTVMYRKSAVLSVGGYRSLRRGEDYDLFARLLHAGCYAQNISDVLVKARVNPDAMFRRASFSTFKGCVRSRWNAWRIGFISLWDLLYCSAGALLLSIVPSRLQHLLYRKFLRT